MFDLLIPRDSPARARALMSSLAAGAKHAGLDARVGEVYAPRPGSVLMLYGLGGADRLPYAKQHMQAGGLLVAWDAGYWERELDFRSRKYRVSINGFHPPAYVMRGLDPGPARWLKSGLSFVEAGGSKAGSILLIGNTPKSCAVGAAGWTAAKSRELRAAFPGCRIAYRPKPGRPRESGVSFDEVSTDPIGIALTRASLVVCKHSNVAVDACRHGVPVVCEDGAAAAIYPHALADAKKQPTAAQRLEFLHRLAWWQWSPDEAERGEAWRWLCGVLDAVRGEAPPKIHAAWPRPRIQSLKTVRRR